jgi:hypothetical protein
LHPKTVVVMILAVFTGIACLLLPIAADERPVPQKPTVVRLVKNDDGWQLLRNGEPYFIKGVGGDGPRKALALAGGNSVRTWGTDRLQPLLDEAQQLGLSVTVGIWLGHERHGFDWNDADQVARQYEMVRETVLRYKDHPAVLLWALGNEMEGYQKGDNAAIWSALNNLAALVKKLDPNHPTMTVVAEIGGDRVKNLHRLCPDIDIIGINSYGGVASLPKRYQAAGGVKPYIVTEFGPPGIWETPKTDWGAAPEPTSTAKAEFYRQAYQQAILAPKGLCLGSYVFTWGHKQEATATWFGMFLPDGSRLGAVDVMTELWSGKPPANRCPRIDSLKLDGADQVDPGATVRGLLAASDPDGDPLKVKWLLQREAFSYGEGGDAEEAPPTFPDAILKADEKQADVRMPKEGGGYRLFAFVYDDHGGAAVANVPLRVKGPVTLPRARVAKLPLIVYDEADREKPAYVPAGWMGNTKALKLNDKWAEKPHGGKTCIRIDYEAKDGWGGIVWQSPANDWGDRPGGWDLTGATKLTFWARGAQGGETVSFEIGIIGSGKTFHDTAKGKVEKVRLTTDWQQFRIDLKDKDLTRIKSGFVCTVVGTGAPITFFLDEIQYE